MFKWIAPIASCLALVAAPAAQAGEPEETIDIRRNFALAVCTGFCPDWRLRVKSSGSAELRLRIWKSLDWQVYRYRISPEEFADFRARLAPVRPRGKQGPIGDCSGALRDPDKVDLDIRWSGGGAAGRILACEGRSEVWRASEAGYRALRINPWTGDRLTSALAAEYFPTDEERAAQTALGS